MLKIGRYRVLGDFERRILNYHVFHPVLQNRGQLPATGNPGKVNLVLGFIGQRVGLPGKLPIHQVCVGNQYFLELDRIGENLKIRGC